MFSQQPIGAQSPNNLCPVLSASIASVFPTTDRYAVPKQFVSELSASSASVFSTTDQCAVPEQFVSCAQCQQCQCFPNNRSVPSSRTICVLCSVPAVPVFSHLRNNGYMCDRELCSLSQRDRNTNPRLHILSDHVLGSVAHQLVLIDPVAQSSIQKASNAA